MRIAIVCNPLTEKLGLGDFLFLAFKELVETVHFNTGEETEGFDHYFYIDDGPSYYDAPKFHPATYLAIDFVVPHVWFVNDHQTYMNRMRNFDHSYVFSSKAYQMCKDNGLNTDLMGFAADPRFHKPYYVNRIYDWIAIWHNCADRPNAIDAAMRKFPNGRVMWAGIGPAWPSDKDYSYHMCTANCALNYPRANIVNMRVFEVMAMNIPLITMRVDDMETFGFKEGEHYLGFDTIEEMVHRIELVNNYPKESHLIANTAFAFVLLNHTYDHRAREMLKMI